MPINSIEGGNYNTITKGRYHKAVVKQSLNEPQSAKTEY